MFRITFPSLASPCVELVCIHAIYQYHTQRAGCEALSAVSLYTDAFVSGLERTHTSCLLIISLWSIFTCSIVSISWNISHDIGIEISQKHYRYWYRIIPKILHGISRTLDTIRNTSSKKSVPTYLEVCMGVRKSFPQLVIYSLYCCTYSPGISNPQHPEPAEST